MADQLMTDLSDARAQLDASIDKVEAGYEFLLAYAAQGRHTDRGGNADNSVRNYLGGMESALAVLAGHVRAMAAEIDPDLTQKAAPFFAAVDSDAAIARAAISLVLAQSDISSQLVDNLNASIHLRAVLTDIFLIDEALKPKKPT
jgi:hypothetical protein